VNDERGFAFLEIGASKRLRGDREPRERLREVVGPGEASH
jgi:hypothetical protein